MNTLPPGLHPTLAAASVRPLASCGASRFAQLGFCAWASWRSDERHAQAAGDLFIYTWTDYTAPAVIAKFEKETGRQGHDRYLRFQRDVARQVEIGRYRLRHRRRVLGFRPDLREGGADPAKIDAPSLAELRQYRAALAQSRLGQGQCLFDPVRLGRHRLLRSTRNLSRRRPTSLKLLFDPPPEAKGKVGMFGSVERGHGACRGLSRTAALPDRSEPR